MARRISIFGATGSIGQNTVDLIARNPEAYDVVAVTGASNIALLADTAKKLNADIAVTGDPALGDALADALADTGIQTGAGREALLHAADRNTDWAMSALVGFAGVEVSIRLAGATKQLALANKESLVSAGPLLKSAVAKSGALLLPVDSEHSAIFQAIGQEPISAVERIVLTASGGPFLDKTVAEMREVTAKEAANHPKWSMGLRISIDSASLFNKAMEVIETKEFFDCTPEQIEVIVHPEAMIHSMVGFKDRALLAHLGPPDMRGAIGYALHYPERAPLPLERLDFAALGQLTFHGVDHARFPSVGLAFDAMKMGGHAGTVFNAAKEQALDLFLIGDILFTDMAELVADALEMYQGRQDNDAMSLASVTEIDQVTRRFVTTRAKERK